MSAEDLLQQQIREVEQKILDLTAQYSVGKGGGTVEDPVGGCTEQGNAEEAPVQEEKEGAKKMKKKKRRHLTKTEKAAAKLIPGTGQLYLWRDIDQFKDRLVIVNYRDETPFQYYDDVDLAVSFARQMVMCNSNLTEPERIVSFDTVITAFAAKFGITGKEKTILISVSTLAAFEKRLFERLTSQMGKSSDAGILAASIMARATREQLKRRLCEEQLRYSDSKDLHEISFLWND